MTLRYTLTVVRANGDCCRFGCLIFAILRRTVGLSADMRVHLTSNRGGKEKKKQKKEDVQVLAERVSGGRMGRSDRLREKRTDCRKTRQLLDRRSPHSITSDQPHITHLIYLPLLLSASPLPLSFLLLFTSPSPLCPLGPWLPCRVGAHSQHYVLAQAGSVKRLLWLIVV